MGQNETIMDCKHTCEYGIKVINSCCCEQSYSEYKHTYPIKYRDNFPPPPSLCTFCLYSICKCERKLCLLGVICMHVGGRVGLHTNFHS
jgi:hypothetical protein